MVLRLSLGVLRRSNAVLTGSLATKSRASSVETCHERIGHAVFLKTKQLTWRTVEPFTLSC